MFRTGLDLEEIWPKMFDFFILEFLVQNPGLITSNLISTLKLEMASWIVAKLLSSQSSIYFYVKF